MTALFDISVLAIRCGVTRGKVSYGATVLFVDTNNDVRLPTDKLACRMDAQPPKTPTVLVSCGSFNPPTYMHLRMFELASQELAQVHMCSDCMAIVHIHMECDAARRCIDAICKVRNALVLSSKCTPVAW